MAPGIPTTLEFLSPFLWRAPPLEMRRERREFFPHHAGKGSLLSSKDAETGLLWMWAGLSCFLSSGDGYVGELLELQQGCEGPFESSRGSVNILETPQRKWASSRLEGRTSCIFSSCGRCSRLTTGTSGTRSGGLRKGQSPCELFWGLSGFLSR